MQTSLISNRTLANGATGGFLLALVTAVLASFGAGLDYQAAEITGLAVMLAGVVIIQVVTLRGLDAAETAAFTDRLRHVLVATVALCAVFGGVLWFHYAVIDPDYLAEFYTRYSNEIMAAASSAEDGAARRAFIEGNREFMLDPFKQAMLMAGTLLGIGGIAGILVAALARRHRDQ